VTELASIHRIDAKKLRELSAPLVNHQRLDVTFSGEPTALLAGYMKVTELEPGMRLRIADVQDLCGLTSRAELPAGIKIALVVEGAARVQYGQQETELGPAARSAGLVVVMPSPGAFVRHGRHGGSERTVTLSLSPQWMMHRGLGQVLQGQNGDTPQLRHWSPSKELHSAARQLFTPASAERNSHIYHMQLSGFALSLAAEALAETNAGNGISGDLAEHMGTEKPDYRIARLMSLIDSGVARTATQEELAQRLGMSLSNLQRRFRAQYGVALGHYLRRYYLNKTREALIRDQVSVETAAEMAGYTSAPNFATAFRREFGVTPSQCRTAARQLAFPGRAKPESDV